MQHDHAELSGQKVMKNMYKGPLQPPDCPEICFFKNRIVIRLNYPVKYQET
jgi:hypothetical protein